MKWAEFKALLSGLSAATPLGEIVRIRAEKDKDVLKHFSREQHRIRNEWKMRRSGQKSEEDMSQVLEMFKNAFLSLAKGG